MPADERIRLRRLAPGGSAVLPSPDLASPLFSGPEVRLGRGEGVDFALDDAPGSPVSRQHARLLALEGAWWIEDLGSRNGTFVNGVLLQGRARLRDGDHLVFGPEGPGFDVELVAGPPVPHPDRGPMAVVALGGLAALALVAWLLFGGGVIGGGGAGGSEEVGGGLRGSGAAEAVVGEFDAGGSGLDRVRIGRSGGEASDVGPGAVHGPGAGEAGSAHAAAENPTAPGGVAAPGMGTASRGAPAPAGAPTPDEAASPGGVAAAGDTLAGGTLAGGALPPGEPLQGAAAPSSAGLSPAQTDLANAARRAVALVWVEDALGRVVTGTAFALRPDGLLVTVRHLVLPAGEGPPPRRIGVQFSDSDQVWEARLEGVSTEVDLAALRLTGLDWREVPRIDGLNLRPDTLPLGAELLVVGFPEGGDGAAEGRGLARPRIATSRLEVVTPSQLQLRGPGESGASGSPVLDPSGRVVGVVYGGFGGGAPTGPGDHRLVAVNAVQVARFLARFPVLRP